MELIEKQACASLHARRPAKKGGRQIIETKPKVLVVDDEPDICELLEFELTDAGYNTATASSVDDGLEKFLAEPTDIILSDVRMPGKNGLVLLNAIHAAGHRPLFVFMTGYSDVSLQQIYEEGAAGLFNKPLDQEALLAFLQRTLQTLQENKAFGSRDSSRVQTTIPARISQETKGAEAIFLTATISNISRSGAFFSLDQGNIPAIGDQVNFAFHDTAIGARPVYGRGECRWIGRDKNTDQLGFGLKFHEINPQSFEAFFVHMTRLGSVPKQTTPDSKKAG